MLNKLMLALCGLLFLAVAAGAGQITWGSDNLISDTGFSAGSEDWLVILVVDDGADGIDDIYLSADMTALVFTESGTVNPGNDVDTGTSETLIYGSKTGQLYWGTTFDSTDGGTPGWGDSVYTIILNSTTIAGADQFIVMDGAAPTDLPDSNNNSVYTFPDDAPYGTWQDLNVVPEPGTMGLMALGLAVIGIRRRKS